MYKNENNDRIVETLKNRVKELVENDDQLEGGFMPYLVPMMDSAVKNNIIGGTMLGGSALGSTNQFMDTGFEMGAGKGVAVYEKGGKKQVACDCPVGSGMSGGKKRGRPKKAKKEDENVVMDMGMEFSEDMMPVKSKRGRPKKGGAVVRKDVVVGGMLPKSGMKSSNMSGGGARSKRAEIVKKIMKERGVKMIEASKIVKKEGLYKK
jgi:hypothetical protein